MSILGHLHVTTTSKTQTESLTPNPQTKTVTNMQEEKEDLKEVVVDIRTSIKEAKGKKIKLNSA